MYFEGFFFSPPWISSTNWFEEYLDTDLQKTILSISSIYLISIFILKQ